MTLNSLLNNQNIYSNMPQPIKCDNKYVPMSPPQDCEEFVRTLPQPDCQEFVRSLPPIDNNFLPMSPDFSDEGKLRGGACAAYDENNLPRDHTKNSLSSLISSQSRPNEITRLPTSLIDKSEGEPSGMGEGAAQIVFGANVRTSNLSLNSEHSADF